LTAQIFESRIKFEGAAMSHTTRHSFGQFLAIAVALSAAAAYAWGQGHAMRTPLYDTNTEVTFSGVVQAVKEVPGAGRGTGTHLIVKADDEMRTVHVGPTWYLEKNSYSFSKGDRVEVTGSKVKYQGEEVVIAREIKKDGHTWTLRNEQGVPLWSRQGPRP
jgi:hypothetical protein